MTRRLLFVCLGNICRSPTAEAVFRSLAAREGLDVQADGAGTGDWHVGSAPDPRMIDAAAARGYDLHDLRARQAVADDFERFDLILAMDRSNLSALERLRPQGAGAPVRLLLDYAGRQGADVPDPYMVGGFDHVVTLIEDAASGLIDSLRG